MALADKLGVSRFAVSVWKRRQNVPAKYLTLITQPGVADASDPATKADRIAMFGKPERSFWLAATLAAMPTTVFESRPEDDWERGLRLGKAVLEGMGLAMKATRRHLGKGFCADEADCAQLVQVLRSDYADDLDRITR
jgi:hypothetical protein